MHDIIATKKMQDDVVVMWSESGSVKSEHFNYQDLIDLKINVLDLLDRPKAYQVDPKAHKIAPKK